MDIWKNTDLKDLEGEIWEDVLSYDGIYQVSNLGRVKSIGRFVSNGGGRERWVKEKILKQYLPKKSELNVKLSVGNVKKTWNVVTLVANAFLKRRNKNEIVCQLNKIKTDCRLKNLKIMSYSESVKIGYEKGVLSDWGISSTLHPSTTVSQRIKYEKDKGIFDDAKMVAIECQSCKKIKSIKDFYKKEKSLNRVCKDCIIKKSGVKNVGKKRLAIELANKGLRKCFDCNQVKKLNEDFGKSKKSFMGRNNICKSCANIRNKKYNALR